jgi:predicted RNA-binding Zn-ribbon protein involved in translation (DUF1610 family)
MAAYYVGYLERDQRIELLAEVHGAPNVIVEGDEDEDEGATAFVDWRCPACGMAGVQRRSETRAQCYGCLAQYPLDEKLFELPEATVSCVGCGSPVSIPAGQHEAQCGACDAIVRRAERSGHVVRRVEARMFHGTAETFGGTPGREVTDDNRSKMIRDGLGTAALVWAGLISARRYLKLATRSCEVGTWPPLHDLLADIEQTLRDDGDHEAAIRLVAQARALARGA